MMETVRESDLWEDVGRQTATPQLFANVEERHI